MLDLSKIQKKFDALFEEETEESFNHWLANKKMNEILAGLGDGDIIDLMDIRGNNTCFTLLKDSFPARVILFTYENPEPEPLSEIQDIMAA